MPADRDPSDETLLEMAQGGDRAAFDELIERYEERFLRMATRILGGAHRSEDAQDAVQIAFLNVFRRIDSYRRRYRASTWLFRVLVNASLDLLRKRKRDPAQGSDEDWAAPPRQAETKIDVQDALDRLPNECRTVFLLRALEGLTYEEIAAVRGVSINTVKTHLRRARRALRTHLEEE